MEGYTSVSVNLETYGILEEWADEGERSVAAQVRLLVKQEQERREREQEPCLSSVD